MRTSLEIIVATLILSFSGAGCSSDSAQSRFVLAEKLWGDGSYSAAVSEFDRIYQNNPNSPLGQSALYRSALTHLLYLERPTDALEKFAVYARTNPQSEKAWEARKWIGEILFARLERFDQAIAHYKQMLKDRPQAREGREFRYRIAKGLFALWKFDEAIEEFLSLSAETGKDPWTEKAAFEVANVLVTAGEQRLEGKGAYRRAIEEFQKYLERYPKGAHSGEALLGLALAYEELEQLDLAVLTLEKAKNLYPVPQVIEIKLRRIEQRRSKKVR